MADLDSKNDSDSSLVEQLAEEYLGRLRNGETPRISDFTQAYPELADEIRDVFSTLAMLEDFKPDMRDEIDSGHDPIDVPNQVGEYRIVRELGRGGMGVVYEAEHAIMRRRVALKVLSPAAAMRKHDLGRFLREARAAGRLHHTNIVPVFEVGEDQGIHFYAMQCIRGQNLDVVIQDLKRLRDAASETTSRPEEERFSAANCLNSDQLDRAGLVRNGDSDEVSLPKEKVDDQESDNLNRVVSDSSELANVGDSKDAYFHRVARVALAVADALSYAHDQGILHRDIKPSNLILDAAGIVWVTDFGLAQSEGENLTRTGDIVGTLRYMAPERFRGEADERSDVYSLGLTLYELCTLRHAFDQSDRGDLIRNVMRIDPPNPSRYGASIPRDLETIVLKAIARDPVARYQTSEDFANDLRLYLDDRPIRARRSSYLEQCWRWCRRNPQVAALMWCVATLLAVICFGAIAFGVRTRQVNEELVAEQAISQSRLFDALFSRAHAERQNRLTGTREDSRSALAKAAAILPTLDLSHQEMSEKRLLLRNEAIAMYGQTDVDISGRFARNSEDSGRRVYNDDYSRYAISSGRIEIRETDTSDLLQTFPQPGSQGTSLRFSPNGKYLVSMHPHEESRWTTRIWDLHSGENLLELRSKERNIVFGNGSRFAVWDAANVNVHDVEDEEPIWSHEVDFSIRQVSFSPDDQTLVAVGDAKEIRFWSLADQSQGSRQIPSGANSIAWNPRTNQIAVGTQKGELLIFQGGDLAKEPIRLLGHDDSIYQVALSNNGAMVASVAWDATLRLWDLRHRMEIKRFVGAHIVTGFSGDSKYLACADPDTQFVLEVVSKGPRYQCYGRELPRRNDVAFHPSQPSTAVVATSFHAEIWNLESNRVTGLLKTERTFSLRFSKDGRHLLSSGRRGLRKWEIASIDSHSRPAATASGETYLVQGDTYQMDASRDLGRIAYVNHSGDVFVVDAEGGEPIQLAELDDGFRPSISPDGMWVVVSQLNRSGLRVWDAQTGKLVNELDARLTTRGVDFSNDGKWLVANGFDRRVLWEVGSWKGVREEPRTEKQSGLAVFSSDGKTIAMTRNRFTVDLVDRDTFSVLAVIPVEDRSNVQQLSFSADDSKLALALKDRAEVWDLSDLRQRLAELDLDW